MGCRRYAPNGTSVEIRYQDSHPYAEDDLERRAEARVRSSRGTDGGLVVEQMAPYLPDYPCNPWDVRFVAKPIDFQVFDGLKHETQDVDIVFQEVKTGDGRLDPNERRVMAAVEAGRIRYEVYRTGDPAAEPDLIVDWTGDKHRLRKRATP